MAEPPTAGDGSDEAPLVAEGHSPFPATGVPRVELPDEPDDEPAPRRHPYTWLHLIVLAIVAFVLGFLIVALWNQGRSDAGTGAAADVVVLDTAPPGSSSAS